MKAKKKHNPHMFSVTSCRLPTVTAAKVTLVVTVILIDSVAVDNHVT